MKAILEGLAVEYSDEGQGPVLLMVHGWMNRMDSFDDLCKELGGSYRIVRLDLPGFGGSETPPDSWHVVDYANLVQALVEKLGLASYTFIGHSLGGRIALRGIGSGILHPEKLVLIDAAGLARRRTLRNRAFTLIAKAGKALTVVPPFSRWRHALRKRLYARLGSDYFAAGSLSRLYLNIIQEDLAPYAPKVACPALIVWGSEDRTTPLAEGERIHELIAGSRLEVLEGVGHAPHRERPQEVAQLIKDFV